MAFAQVQVKFIPNNQGTYHLMGICIEWKTTMVNVSTGDALWKTILQ
jgi:hypothetical protein